MGNKVYHTGTFIVEAWGDEYMKIGNQWYMRMGESLESEYDEETIRRLESEIATYYTPKSKEMESARDIISLVGTVDGNSSENCRARDKWMKEYFPQYL